MGPIQSMKLLIFGKQPSEPGRLSNHAMWMLEEIVKPHTRDPITLSSCAGQFWGTPVFGSGNPSVLRYPIEVAHCPFQA